MYSLTVIAVLAFLPLIPAILLFRVLHFRGERRAKPETESQAKVEGQIAPGLKVSLSGAFGGYVALFIVLGTYFMHMPHTTTWHVRGDLLFPNGTPSVISCDVHPPEFNIIGENKFKLDLPIAEGDAPPSIVISATGYETKTIDLVDSDGNMGGEFDARKHEALQLIKVNKPIIFKATSNYQTKIAEGGRP